jgi:ABC-type multidrug transport system fused ATPase/permease subunit
MSRLASLSLCIAGAGLGLLTVALTIGSTIGISSLKNDIIYAGIAISAFGLMSSNLPQIARSWRRVGPQTKELEDLADQLAFLVTQKETEDLKQLIANNTLNLQFALTDQTFGLDQILEHYQRSASRRLVIVGPGGSGKAVTLITLTLRLLEIRDKGKAVPLRLSLSTWDPDHPFEEWIATQVQTLQARLQLPIGSKQSVAHRPCRPAP